jgi:hypothetical protein
VRRGAVATAITWVSGWSLVGIPWAMSEYIWHWRGGFHQPFKAFLHADVTSFALLGALSGAVFSVVLALAERRERIETLRWRRIAGWGVVGAVVPALVLLGGAIWRVDSLHFGWWMVSGIAVSSTLGLTSAVGMLAMARRTEAIELPRMPESS